MNIVIQRSYLSSMGYSGHDLYLNDQYCRPSVSSYQVVFSFPLNTCGTRREVPLFLISHSDICLKTVFLFPFEFWLQWREHNSIGHSSRDARLYVFVSLCFLGGLQRENVNPNVFVNRSPMGGSCTPMACGRTGLSRARSPASLSSSCRWCAEWSRTPQHRLCTWRERTKQGTSRGAADSTSPWPSTPPETSTTLCTTLPTSSTSTSTCTCRWSWGGRTTAWFCSWTPVWPHLHLTISTTGPTTWSATGKVVTYWIIPQTLACGSLIMLQMGCAYNYNICDLP